MAGGFKGTWPGGRIYWRDLGDEPEVPNDEPGSSRRVKAEHPSSSPVLTGQESGPSYFIWKHFRGKKWRLSTRADNERDAMKEWIRFEGDPDRYAKERRSTTQVQNAPVNLTRALVDEFLTWSKEKGHHGHGNTVGHVANQRIAMEFWLTHLKRRDLRKLDLQQDIQGPLKGQPQQANRRRTLRSFYSWLRSEEGGHRLRLADDPTFKALKVPRSDPKRRKKANKAVAWEHLLAVQKELDRRAEVASRTSVGTFAAGSSEAPWGAVFRVQMATGWHETELARFARDGHVEKYAGPMQGAAAVLVCPQHKIGGEFRTAVDGAALDAAKELRAYGSFEPKNYIKAVRTAAEVVAAKQANLGVPEERRVEVFTPGQVRHSVATYMISQGATVYEVATFLNHRSLETTKKFYATHSIPWNPLLGVNPTRVTGAA